MANLGETIAKIKADDELKKQFAEAVKNKTVIAFLSTQGCDTAEEEVNEFLSAKKTELSDEQLDKVSGGGCSGGDVAVSVLTAGTTCAASSIVDAIDGKGCMSST